MCAGSSLKSEQIRITNTSKGNKVETLLERIFGDEGNKKSTLTINICQCQAGRKFLLQGRINQTRKNVAWGRGMSGNVLH